MKSVPVRNGKMFYLLTSHRLLCVHLRIDYTSGGILEADGRNNAVSLHFNLAMSVLLYGVDSLGTDGQALLP